PIEFSLKTTQAGEWQNLSVQQTFYRQKLEQSDIWLRNDSDHDVRVMVSNRGVPANLQEQEQAQASSEGLNLSAKFFTLDGDPLSVESLPQGTDFVAEVTVSAEFARLPGNRIENLALTLVMPSGWQIRNERLEGEQLPKGVDFMDIRDDRVLGYFSLWRDYSSSYRYNDRYQQNVTLRVILNASYAGKFYLPAWQVTAMYNEKIHAKTRGYWVEVVGE